MTEPSLWELDDVDATAIKVRDTVVGPVSTKDVRDFCQRWHYTGNVGNDVWRWGLWHETTILGVISYNLPTRRTCESVFGPEHFDKVWHMGRLVMADAAPPNSESRLISGSLRFIQSEHPNVWAVVTFAAVDAGHVGYVYQATNAIYTGTGGQSIYFVDQRGERRSTYHNGHMVTLARAAELGWTRVLGDFKHRYVYILGDRRQRRERLALLRYESLPYPKGDAA